MEHIGPIDQAAWYVDTTQDFMSTENRVVRMNQIAAVLGPWMMNLWFLNFYMSDDKNQYITHYVTSTESKEMLTI